MTLAELPVSGPFLVAADSLIRRYPIDQRKRFRSFFLGSVDATRMVLSTALWVACSHLSLTWENGTPEGNLPRDNEGTLHKPWSRARKGLSAWGRLSGRFEASLGSL